MVKDTGQPGTMSTSHAEDPANADTIEATPEAVAAGAELQPGEQIGRYTVVRSTRR